MRKKKVLVLGILLFLFSTTAITALGKKKHTLLIGSGRATLEMDRQYVLPVNIAAGDVFPHFDMKYFCHSTFSMLETRDVLHFIDFWEHTKPDFRCDFTKIVRGLKASYYKKVRFTLMQPGYIFSEKIKRKKEDTYYKNVLFDNAYNALRDGGYVQLQAIIPHNLMDARDVLVRRLSEAGFRNIYICITSYFPKSLERYFIEDGTLINFKTPYGSILAFAQKTTDKPVIAEDDSMFYKNIVDYKPIMFL